LILHTYTDGKAANLIQTAWRPNESTTAHNQIAAGTFHLPSRKLGKNRVVDVRDLAEYVDKQRDMARQIFSG
jgi:hypothetical protein